MTGLQKIGDLAAHYGISTRTLRYYEEIGLLHSSRESDTQQRWYGCEATARLEQILLLRRMELPLKDVQAILATQELQVAVDAFVAKLHEVDAELDRLQRLHSLVDAFLVLLRERGYTRAAADLLMLEGDLVSPEPPKRKESPPMTLPGSAPLTHVRILELKPMKVAYYQVESPTPEKDAYDVMLAWAQGQGLTDLPTTRYFGFNNPEPSPDRQGYGYEVWVTVPEGVKASGAVGIKEFGGGLYAVVTTYLYEIFERWQALGKWVEQSDEYSVEQRQWLEESINLSSMHSDKAQIDLFLPIRRK